MASEVDLCCNALGQLGEEGITSLDDNSKKARVCKRFYPDTRDSVLRTYPWRCATEFQTLTQLSGADAIIGSEFTLTYQLPTNPWCLRALLLNNDKSVRWEVIGRKLCTDEPTVTLRFIKRVTDPGMFDTLLYDAISSRIAMKLAYPITGKPDLAPAMWKLYELVLDEARAIDSQEGHYDEYQSDDLVDVR